MKNTIIKNWWGNILICLCIFTSCKPDLEVPSWDVSILSPIAFTSININDFASDSIFSEDSLNVLYYHHEIDIDSFKISDLTELEEKNVTKNVKLSNINFNDITILHSITLGSIFQPLGFQNGMQLANGLPAFPGIFSDIVNINANDYFQSMTLSGGELIVTLTNNLPSDLSNIEMNIINDEAGSIIANIVFPYISVGQTSTYSYDLSGLTIDGDLVADIINIDLVGTNFPTIINFQDDLSAVFKIENIAPVEGNAIFPEQIIYDEKIDVSFELDDVLLKKAILRNGEIEIEAVNTIQDTVKILYEIPGATLNGIPFVLNTTLPPAPVDGSITVTEIFDFSNYELDLTGELGDTVNTLYTSSIGRIDSSGTLTHISLNDDSLFYSLKLKNLFPRYIEGYIGQDTIAVDTTTVEFDVFKNMSGHIDIQEAEVSLKISNGFGVSTSLEIEKLSTTNAKGTELILSGEVASDNILVPAANNNPISYAEKTIVFDEINSNIDNILESFPKSLFLRSKAYINPNNNNSGFIYDSHGITSSIKIEIPLSFSSNGLILKDTVNINIESINEISAVNFKLIIENGYPFSANVNVRFLNNNYTLLEELDDLSKIAAAETTNNGSTTKVKTIIDLPAEDLVTTLNNSQFIEFEAILRTEESQFEQLTNQQELLIKIVGYTDQTIEY
ncbi:MAG: hypothetical protein CMP75_00600 [Flavobacteriales bacterium]|nr:hypothetical protein [Flavobacteriales bacterium]|tara:strand:- start:1343 stop:3370 length:2028 start_codon:yes stop_codon:yes gene_type:complete